MKLPIRNITYVEEELPDDLATLLDMPQQASPETVLLFQQCAAEAGNLQLQEIGWTDGTLDLSLRYRGCDMRYMVGMDAPGSYSFAYGFREDMPQAIRPPHEEQRILYPLLMTLAAKAYNFPLQEETDAEPA